MNARIQFESLRFCSKLLYWEALNLLVIGYVCRRIAQHYNSFNERLVWQSSDIILLPPFPTNYDGLEFEVDYNFQVKLI